MAVKCRLTRLITERPQLIAFNIPSALTAGILV